MPNTRDFKSLGPWAEDAVVPPAVPPTPGVAYRDDALTESQNKAGDPYDIKPDSAQFNQKMWVISSITDMQDRHGLLGWTNLVDYVLPAIVWGSDARFYQAIQPSGPSTAPEDPVDEVDPVDAPVFWELVTSAATLRRELNTSTPGSEGARLVNYNKFDINGGVDEPLNVKDALDEGLTGAQNLHGLTLIMAGSFSGTTGLIIGNAFNIYQNKAFIVADPTNPAIIHYNIFPDELFEGVPSEFLFLQIFVSVQAAQNPALPPGNFAATVPGTNKDNVLLPGGMGGQVSPVVQVWQYPLNPTFSETLQEDFDLIVFGQGVEGPTIE